MKRVIGGNGADTTAAVQAWLQKGNNLLIKHLYLIGEADHPQSIWLTDYEAPLVWPLAGTFQPAVVKRGTISQEIGLDVKDLQVTWHARNRAAGNTVRSASPYQLARAGFYDNWPVRVWTVYMPSPGDAMTFGCSAAWGGRIGSCKIGQGSLEFQVKSFLDIVNQYVPTNVIELQNTVASYTGATPPQGYSSIPRFAVEVGSSTNVIVGYQTTPNAGGILHTDSVRGGFLVFEHHAPDLTATPPFPGSTVEGLWGAIQQNTGINTAGTGTGISGQPVGGGVYNQFILYSALPWPPTPGLDTFYVSGASPINKADGSYFGFPFVPSAETGV